LKSVTTQNKMSRQTYKLSTDYYSLSAEWKESILVEVMKLFMEHGKPIRSRLLSDAMKAKAERTNRNLYNIDKEVKNSKEAIKVYYKQYKHLDKYYPKDLEFSTHFSLQRGERAVDIGKKFEMLIRSKRDSKIWAYDDDEDNVRWVNPEAFKYLKKEIKKGEIEKEDITKDNIQIGDVTWYAIKIGHEDSMLNWGIMSLANELMKQGEYFVFDNESNRDNYYTYLVGVVSSPVASAA
jgi:hypothetical protein